MSNSLAVEAVTDTLIRLLENGTKNDAKLGNVQVTAKSPDKARENQDSNQINIFLYQTSINAAFQNMDMPARVRPGETGRPPLALNLNYLITAYGKNNEDALSHRLLGKAMHVFHDYPLLIASDLLHPDELKDLLSESELDVQQEHVRLTPVPLTLDEMSKIWMIFQTQYRISAAYQATVVLIESDHLAKAPLPVLTRGPGDQGPTSQPDLVPPFPAIESVLLPNNQPSARLDDAIIILGHHLDSPSSVRFTNPLWSKPEDVQPDNSTSTEIKIKIPNLPEDWPAGFYTIAALIQRKDENDLRTTNVLPFTLAPKIEFGPDQPNPALIDGDGNVTLTIISSPQIFPEQRATLLLGDREILSRPHPAKTETLIFDVTKATTGAYFVRLRVDGVDSLLVDRSKTPLQFDETQKVTIL